MLLSLYLLHKKRVWLILPEKCRESLHADCEVLVTLIRKRTLVKHAHCASSYRNILQKYQWDKNKLRALLTSAGYKLVYALALLSFMWNMFILLAIFFTIKVTEKVSPVLKSQLYTGLRILNHVFNFIIYILRLMREMFFYKINHFFKSSNWMIHPYVFLILCQSKVNKYWQ